MIERLGLKRRRRDCDKRRGEMKDGLDRIWLGFC